MSTYLVTGCAGFIGAKVTEFLLADGHTVIGVDNLNDAYDVRLKRWRLAQIKDHPDFTFHHLDICDRAALHELFKSQVASRSSTPSSIWRRGRECDRAWPIPGCTLKPTSLAL